MTQKLDFKKVHQDTFIDVRKDIEKPPIAISIGETHIGQQIYDTPFGTFGNFSCIVGQSKSKKTFFKSAITSGFVGGETNRYFELVKTHRAKDMYVLDFDTEQSDWHAQRVFKRVPKMVGGNYDFYKPFYLRKLPYYERLQFIEWCVLESEYKDNIGLIVIDGFADLVKDVNDLEDCNNLVQKLLSWTDISKAHLTGILHKNYGSNKPTGHLGSAILKKAETVCQLDVDESNPSVTNITFPYTRGFNIVDLSLHVDNYGLPIIEESVL